MVHEYEYESVYYMSVKRMCGKPKKIFASTTQQNKIGKTKKYVPTFE